MTRQPTKPPLDAKMPVPPPAPPPKKPDHVILYPMNLNGHPTTADVLDRQRKAREEILRVLGIPPPLTGRRGGTSFGLMLMMHGKDVGDAIVKLQCRDAARKKGKVERQFTDEELEDEWLRHHAEFGWNARKAPAVEE